MAKSLYSQDELDTRQRAYYAAGRSLSGQSLRYLMWLYETSKYESEREFLRGIIITIGEIYCQPH